MKINLLTMQKYIYTIALLLAIPFIGNAQSLTPDIITTAGDFNYGNSFTLSWTLGEPMIETYVSNNVQLSQGFQQTFLGINATNPVPGIYDSFLAPVPASDIIQLNLSEKVQLPANIEIFNYCGRKILSQEMETRITPIDIDNFETGFYLMHIRGNNNSNNGLLKFIKL